MSNLPEKIDNRKPAHSQKPLSSIRPRKGGGGSKGAWGSPMDEIRQYEHKPVPKDEIYARSSSKHAASSDEELTEEGDVVEEVMVEAKDQLEDDYIHLDEEYNKQFQSNVESLQTFKAKIEELTRLFFRSDEDEDAFVRGVEVCNAPHFHNQVTKVLLFTTISAGEQSTYRPVRQLLDNLAAKGIVTKAQLASSFRRLFHRINDMSLSNPNAYDDLSEFADYAVDKGHVEASFVQQLKRQTEFARNKERVQRLKKRVDTIVNELFSSSDIVEAMRCVRDLKTPFYNFEVVKRMISVALDRDNRCKELTSQFLCRAVGDSHEDTINRESLMLGFSVLLQRVEDLYKDVPDVLELLSFFLGRAIVDEALPRAFLETVDLLETDMGYAVLFKAQKMLSGKRAAQRLAGIWGASSDMSVKDLKGSIRKMVKEFLEEEDVNEMVTQVKDLRVPLFSHEIVKQLVPAVADYVPPNLDGPVKESVREEKARLVVDLLTICEQHNVIPTRQLHNGFKRVRDRMADLILDCPKIEKYYNLIAMEFPDVPLCGTNT